MAAPSPSPPPLTGDQDLKSAQDAGYAACADDGASSIKQGTHGYEVEVWGLYVRAYIAFLERPEVIARTAHLYPSGFQATGLAGGIIRDHASCIAPVIDLRVPLVVREHFEQQLDVGAKSLAEHASAMMRALLRLTSPNTLAALGRRLSFSDFVQTNTYNHDEEDFGTASAASPLVDSELSIRRERINYETSNMPRKLEFKDQADANDHFAQRLPTALQTMVGSFLTPVISHRDPVIARNPVLKRVHKDLSDDSRKKPRPEDEDEKKTK